MIINLLKEDSNTEKSAAYKKLEDICNKYHYEINTAENVVRKSGTIYPEVILDRKTSNKYSDYMPETIYYNADEKVWSFEIYINASLKSKSDTDYLCGAAEELDNMYNDLLDIEISELPLNVLDY